MNAFLKFALWLLPLPALGACNIATPYRTIPGAPALSDKALVVVTNATLAAGSRHRADFWDGVEAIEASLEQQPGLLGYSIRRQLFGREVWTLTAWQDEASLRQFVGGTVHRRAAEAGLPALESVRFARTQLPVAQLPPSWDEAEALLRTGAGYGYGAAP